MAGGVRIVATGGVRKSLREAFGWSLRMVVEPDDTSIGYRRALVKRFGTPILRDFQRFWGNLAVWAGVGAGRGGMTARRHRRRFWKDPRAAAFRMAGGRQLWYIAGSNQAGGNRAGGDWAVGNLLAAIGLAVICWRRLGCWQSGWRLPGRRQSGCRQPAGIKWRSGWRRLGCWQSAGSNWAVGYRMGALRRRRPRRE